MKTINKELFSQQSCNFKFLAKEGFNTPKYYDFETYDDFENLIIDNLNTHTESGVVGFVQELEAFDGDEPKNVFFEYNDVVKSILVDIIWVSNPNGEIIPTAKFEDITIGATSYTSCSLKNVAYLEKLITSKKMKIGDEVYITLKDENIPTIIGVAKHNNKTEISVPTNCPVCNSDLELINYKFICGSDKCAIKVADILTNYFELLNHKSLDATLLSTLVNKFGVTSITDLRKLPEDTVKQLKEGDTIFKLINDKQKINKQQLINLTQPRNNGIGVIGHFMNNTDLAVLLNENTIANDIVDINMVDESSRDDLIKAISNQLSAIRENSILFDIADNSANVLDNHIFCLTNTMKKATMKKYESLIIENGGRIGTVSMKLNFLVTNKINNTKYKKAVETNTKLYNSGKTHSIAIIDENELLKMMEK